MSSARRSKKGRRAPSSIHRVAGAEDEIARQLRVESVRFGLSPNQADNLIEVLGALLDNADGVLGESKEGDKQHEAEQFDRVLAIFSTLRTLSRIRPNHGAIEAYVDPNGGPSRLLRSLYSGLPEAFYAVPSGEARRIDTTRSNA